MKLFIQKLDGRYTGSRWFDYRIEFRSANYGYVRREDVARQYQTMIQWLWEQYGPGCERDLWKMIAVKDSLSIKSARENGPKWAWCYNSKEISPYIYITNDTILSHIQLRWAD